MFSPNQQSWANAASVRNLRRMIQPEGDSYKDLFDPTYWALVAPQMVQYDVIEVLREDGSYYAQLLVVGTAKTWTKVKELSYTDLTEGVEKVSQAEDEYIVKQKGPVKKFCIIRTKDQKIIREGIQTKAQAFLDLEEFERNMAA